MTLRKLAGVVPAIAVLALAAPVASASAQTTAIPGAAAASGIPCYPYPALCNAGGQPWFSSPLSSLFLSQLPFSPFAAPTVHFGPGPVQLP
jgi:hypothetical protein